MYILTMKSVRVIVTTETELYTNYKKVYKELF